MVRKFRGLGNHLYPTTLSWVQGLGTPLKVVSLGEGRLMKDRKPNRPGTRRMQNSHSGPADRDAGLGRDIQSKIGDQLRAMYDDVVSQGVPDRFSELLKRLDRQDGGDRS